MPAWPLPIPGWFWAWARWRLGRGEFKGHANDPKLRPASAPAHVPAWAWARLKLLVQQKPVPQPSVRDRILRWAEWGIANEPRIHYSESTDRDDWLAHGAGALPMTTDCSGFVTACYRWAGAPDPNGLEYRSLGYTGTLLDHGRIVSWTQAKRGDLAIFGSGTGHHVVVLLEDGIANNGNPWVCSHGQEAGPIRLRIRDEQVHQPAGLRYRSYID
jgi:hypothetical protein